MGTFRFKKFTVSNERSAMKVNTDAVLLGASATLNGSKVLDIGTGTGTIALMLAQRMEEAGHQGFSVLGIDIDEPSAQEAADNFSNSPWKGCMEAQHIALQGLGAEESFDLIVSNPPYFDDSLQNPDERESCARHNICLSYREILAFAASSLSANGRISLILPADTEKPLMREARSRGLFADRVVRIKTTERKPFLRIIAEFTRERCDTREEILILQDGNQRSAQYAALTKDFYLV